MNYSTTHKLFAHRLRQHSINYQDVLDHPENYLGPNYKEVLNYWFYHSSWNYKQFRSYDDRYYSLSREAFFKASNTSRELAKEVIDPIFIYSLEYDDLELIAAHLYLERDIPFTFLPLIFDL